MIQLKDQDKKFLKIMDTLMSKNRVPVLTMINVSVDPNGRLMLYGTNMDVVLTYTRPFNDGEKLDGEFILEPCKVLKAKGTVGVETFVSEKASVHNIRYKMGALSTECWAMDKDDFPGKIDGFDEELSPQVIIQWDTMRQLQSALSEDETRMPLNGWLFTEHGIAGTDGRRLHAKRCVTGIEKIHGFTLLPNKVLDNTSTQKLLSKGVCSVQLFGKNVERANERGKMTKCVDEFVYFCSTCEDWTFEMVHKTKGTPPNYVQVIPDIVNGGHIHFTDEDVEVIKSVKCSKDADPTLVLNGAMKFTIKYQTLEAPFKGKKTHDTAVHLLYIKDIFDLGIKEFKQADGMSPLYGKNDDGIEAVLMPKKLDA